jgi:hypothetical protein
MIRAALVIRHDDVGHAGIRAAPPAGHGNPREVLLDMDAAGSPGHSCCHDQECKPAASKFELGHWWAKQEDGNEWVPIPDGKIEQERDSPDGRSHLCMRRIKLGQYSVYCFVRGAGPERPPSGT